VSNTKTLSVPALGGEQSLNRYLSEIKKFPVLTQEQEYMLAKRYEEHDDTEAAAQLVTSHLRLVAKTPWVTAATACPFRTSFPKAMSA
jgi:RNA polymerase sigma-32 factor